METTLYELCGTAFSDAELETMTSQYAEILPHTDARLQVPCIPMDQSFIESGEIFPLLLMMTSHLKTTGGIGLAANQVGCNRRIMVLIYDEDPLVIINPHIGLRRGKRSIIEHCLSVDGGRTGYLVDRAKKINVRFDSFRNIDDEVRVGACQATLEGQGAVAFQHEFDHLNGLTIVQRGKKVEPAPQEVQ